MTKEYLLAIACHYIDTNEMLDRILKIEEGMDKNDDEYELHANIICDICNELQRSIDIMKVVLDANFYP